MKDEIKLFEVIAVTKDLPKYNLFRGEIGAIVEVHPTGAFEVEFVAEDGYTYALVTLRADQVIPLRQKRTHSDMATVSAAL